MRAKTTTLEKKKKKTIEISCCVSEFGTTEYTKRELPLRPRQDGRLRLGGYTSEVDIRQFGVRRNDLLSDEISTRMRENSRDFDGHNDS